MNTLLGILNYPLTHQIGWALLHSLWQGALVGAVFALLRFALAAALGQRALPGRLPLPWGCCWRAGAHAAQGTAPSAAPGAGLR